MKQPLAASAIERTAEVLPDVAQSPYQQRGQLGVKGGLRIYLIDAMALGHLGYLSGRVRFCGAAAYICSL